MHARAAELAGKLDAQDDGVARRGRKLCDSRAKARFFHEVGNAHLNRIIKVDLQSDVFTYEVDSQAPRRAAPMDGKLMLMTNVVDSAPPRSYSATRPWPTLSEASRCSSSRSRLPPAQRIKAHASICFMALILYGSCASATACGIDNGAPFSGISTINQDQAAIMAAMKVKKLSAEPQLPYL